MSGAGSIKEHFADLTEPRRGEVTHPLLNIVVIAVCAVICGADVCVAIARWAETKKGWLAKFLDMTAGVPSHDRFNAVLAAIKPAEFEKCLLSWITSLHEITAGQVVPIDGKTLRRSSGTVRSMVGGERQVGDSHGQRVGERQSDQPRPGDGR